MKLRVLASGSGGNALCVQSGTTLALLDCGLSCRELERRMAVCGIDVRAVSAVLFTHNHSDHYAGLETFHGRHPAVPLFANGLTADAIAARTGVHDGWCVFETAEPFGLGALTVTTFSLSHDATDPVGYLFDDGTSRLFVGTDMGIATDPVKEALCRATCAVLESNHDVELLQRSGRAPALIRRILGRSGHLSNRDAADVIREVAPSGLKILLLAHLSEDCNRPHLAEAASRAALAEIGRPDVVLATLSQHEPSTLYAF
ncbi:MAG: MBL fold metallo-hydrolase [Kiritimatiellia bacterium]